MAPTVPNSMGISTLEVLMIISLQPSASPWRASGVIWCKVLMIMGCTEPKVKPSSTEQVPMAQAVYMKG